MGQEEVIIIPGTKIVFYKRSKMKYPDTLSEIYSLFNIIIFILSALFTPFYEFMKKIIFIKIFLTLI